MALLKFAIDTDTREVAISIRTTVDKLTAAAEELGEGVLEHLAAMAEPSTPYGFSFVDAAARRRDIAREREEMRRSLHASSPGATRSYIHNILAVSDE